MSSVVNWALKANYLSTYFLSFLPCTTSMLCMEFFWRIVSGQSLSLSSHHDQYIMAGLFRTTANHSLKFWQIPAKTNCFKFFFFFHGLSPEERLGDFWCLPPVWNLRAASLIPLFYYIISSLVFLPSLVTFSALSFSAYFGPFSWFLIFLFCFLLLNLHFSFVWLFPLFFLSG